MKFFVKLTFFSFLISNILFMIVVKDVLQSLHDGDDFFKIVETL